MKGRCWVRYKYSARDKTPPRVLLPPSPDDLDAKSTLSRKRKSGGDEWAKTQTPLLKRARTAISLSTYKRYLDLRKEVEELGDCSRLLNTALSGSRTTRHSTQDSAKGPVRKKKQPQKEVQQKLPTSIPETSASTAPKTSTTSTTELPGSLYVIERLLSERTTLDGEVEILVKWEDYGDEEATWELESELAESAPEMVRLWRAQKGIEDQVFEVERILGKDGDCYIVQWVGFPLARDRTRERCSKLMVDVPLMVQDFERKREGGEVGV
jgi:hypothetical protein